MTQYVAVKIPKELAKLIDEVLAEGRYATRSEFVRDAVRRRMDKIKAMKVND